MSSDKHDGGDVIGINVKTDIAMSSLEFDIVQHRKKLNLIQLITFDKFWGIQCNYPRAIFKAGGREASTLTSMELSQLVLNAHEKNGKVRWRNESHLRLYQQLKECNEMADKIAASFKDNNATDAEVGFDIVRRLILDIMGRNTHNAKIFENKTNSEFLSTRIVTHEMKIIVFAGVCSNCCCICWMAGMTFCKASSLSIRTCWDTAENSLSSLAGFCTMS